MAKAMSEKLGVEFKLVGTSFDVIIPGLVSKRFDAGFSSFGVTEERLQSLDFVPQRREGTAYASLKGKNFNIQGEKDLCGHSIAVLTGAWDFQYLTKVSAETCKGVQPIDLQQFTTQNAAELAVSSGRVEIDVRPEDGAEAEPGHQGEQSRPGPDERVRTHAGALLPYLTLDADHHRQHERDQQQKKLGPSTRGR